MASFVPPDPAALLALCADSDAWMALLAGLTSGRGIAVSLFVAGLISGFTHCSGMCGPFVLMRVVGREASHPPASVLRRVGGATLWRYHLGRAATYSALGAAAAGAAGVVLEWAGLRWALALVLAAIAAVLTLAALRGVMPAPSSSLLPRVVAAIIGPASRLGDFPLGLALGLLPCGVLYG